MMVLLVGGPYDGRRIWASHLLQHTTTMVFRSVEGTQQFLCLPDPADWQAVLDGAMKLDDSRQYYYYELLNTPEGPFLRFDADRETVQAAISRAIRDEPDRNGHMNN